MFPRSSVISTVTVTTMWMTALLSLGARSCRGFRSSSGSTASLSIPAVRVHRGQMRSFQYSGGTMGGPPRAFFRPSEDFHRFGHPKRNNNNHSHGRFFLSMSSQNNLITSPKSQTVKKVQALLSKRKQRLRLGQTIVEGPRMVFDLLDNPKTSHLVRQILVSARDYELREDYRSRLFENREEPSDVLVQLVHPEVFPDCTDTISPQGIVAIVDIPETSALQHDAKDESSAAAPMYLVLDGVSDPGNLGTLLRSSLAVGVAGVVLLPDCCDTWNPKAVRSAMGASFQIPILESKSWEEALSVLTRGGVQRVYAATMIEDDDEADDGAPSASLPYFDVDWTQGPSALVIGSEGNGLSPVVRQDLVARKNPRTDAEVMVGATHIPMGAGIESLNAAVCGSVILFEYARQCQRPS